MRYNPAAGKWPVETWPRRGHEMTPAVMRGQTLSAVLVGIWVGWTVFMWFAATRSFRTIDAILSSSNPQVAETAKVLGTDQLRMLLRHSASEINRTYFRTYGWAQLILGLVVLGLLWCQSPRDTFSITVVGVMLGLAFILTLLITPQMITVGRSIDFAPRTPPPPVMPRFWKLHGAFTGLDSVKLVAGLVLLVRWIIR